MPRRFLQMTPYIDVTLETQFSNYSPTSPGKAGTLHA